MKEEKSIKRHNLICMIAVIVVVLAVIAYIVVTFVLDTTETANTNLSQKVTVGKLTYYINNDWDCLEKEDKNITYKYYYPFIDTVLMVMVSKNDIDNYYGYDASNEEFLNGYIDGMDNDFISKSSKRINNYNCGIVRCYSNGYETIQYIIANNNECYVFSFGQRSKLNDKYIELTENIIKNAEIITETEEPIKNTNTSGNKTSNKNNNTTNKPTNNKKPTENTQQTTKPTTNTNQQQNNNSQATKPAETTKPNTTTEIKSTEPKPAETVNIQSKYQSILNEYSTKLKNRTPSLITEYKNEASKNTSGLNGLATICNNKVSVLAGISNEGIGKMAEIYYKYGSGKYSKYESWAGKLQDVYMKEAGKIQDVYINSAM